MATNRWHVCWLTIEQNHGISESYITICLLRVISHFSNGYHCWSMWKPIQLYRYINISKSLLSYQATNPCQKGAPSFCFTEMNHHLWLLYFVSHIYIYIFLDRYSPMIATLNLSRLNHFFWIAFWQRITINHDVTIVTGSSFWPGHGRKQAIFLWRFPKMDGDPQKILENGRFPYKQSSYWGSTISGNPPTICIYIYPEFMLRIGKLHYPYGTGPGGRSLR